MGFTFGKRPLGALESVLNENREARLSRLPCDYSLLVAGTTRLELATSGVTGRRSNQTELRPRDCA